MLFKHCYRVCHTLQNTFFLSSISSTIYTQVHLAIIQHNLSINYLRIFIWNLSHHPFTLIVDMPKPKWQSFILWNMGRQGQKSFVAKWSSLSSYTEAINITVTDLPFASWVHVTFPFLRSHVPVCLVIHLAQNKS